MPNRIIRDGILFSVPVSNLTPKAELFYRRLLSCVDDFGRFYAGPPNLLISSCFPLQVHDVKPDEISAWLKELTKQGLIKVYTVEGNPILEIQKFNDRRRAKKSKFPDNPNNPDKCNTDDSQASVKGKSTASRVSPEYEDEDEDENDKKQPQTKLPKKWEPTDSHRATAKREGVNVDKAVIIFRNWADGGGIRRANWNLTFTNALLNESWMKRQAPAKRTVGADGTETKRIKLTN